MSAPQWDGVPMHPERDGPHWVRHKEGGPPLIVSWFMGERHAGWSWSREHYVDAATFAAGWNYLGPCHTPAEVAALVDAARREGAAMEREACAALVGDLQLPQPDTGRWFVDGARMMRENARHRIRARGEKESNDAA